MSISHTRDMDPRIRILSCDPPEPRRRQFDWRLPAAAAAVAGLGIGITLAVTSPTAPPALTRAADPVPVAAEPAQQVTVMASVNAAAVRPTRYLHSSLRDAVRADLRAAARSAEVTLPPAASEPDSENSTPVISNDSAPTRAAITVPAQKPAPATSTPGQNRGPATAQKPATGIVVEPTTPRSGSAPKAVGPEQAPGSGDPATPD